MINRIKDLKQGMICQIQLKIFAAELNGGDYDSMSDNMKFIILSVKNEDLEKEKDRKKIKFLYDGKIYTTWLSGDIEVLVIKND